MEKRENNDDKLKRTVVTRQKSPNIAEKNNTRTIALPKLVPKSATLLKFRIPHRAINTRRTSPVPFFLSDPLNPPETAFAGRAAIYPDRIPAARSAYKPTRE